MRKAKIKQMVSTYELCVYAEEKYGMSNSEWHKKVWRPHFMNYIIHGPATFDMNDVKNPSNILEEQIKDFLEDNTELNGTVTFFFDN